MEVRISIDDGDVKDLKVAEMLEKYGLRGIFYVAPLYQKVQALSEDQVRELSEKHEIASHTLGHSILTKVSIKTADEEIRKGKEELEDILGIKIKKFAPPRGYYNKDIVQLVKQAGFSEMRTMKFGVTDRKKYDKYEIPITAHLYPRPEYYNMGILRGITYLFDKAKEEDGYFNLVVHSQDLDKFELWIYLDEILKYIQENQ